MYSLVYAVLNMFTASTVVILLLKLSGGSYSQLFPLPPRQRVKEKERMDTEPEMHAKPLQVPLFLIISWVIGKTLNTCTTHNLGEISLN